MAANIAALLPKLTPAAAQRAPVLSALNHFDREKYIKKIEAEGIKLDEPYRKIMGASAAITYITDPWGTRVELVQLGL